MHVRTFRRVLLVTLLTTGLAVATETAAFGADVGTQRYPTSDSGKKSDTAKKSDGAKKKKRKKPTIKVASSDLGDILVDAKGMTLYLYTPDGENIDVSQCTGGCASAWPPLTAKKARVGKGLDASFVTVNGDQQVAYNNHLLYYFGGDSAKGDTNGQGVGGVWFVVGADGSAITG